MPDAGQMSVSAIAEKALRRIGAVSIEDEDIPKHWLQEAADWLDIVVQNLTGVSRIAWLVQRTIDLPLIEGEGNYSLVPVNLSAQKNRIVQADQTGTAVRLNSIPDEGVQFPIRASIFSSADPGQSELPVKLARRWEYDGIENKAGSGRPSMIYIDRSMEPVMTVWPIPTDDYQVIRLTFQSFAPESTRLDSQQISQLRSAWKLWAILATGYEMGNGAFKRLPEAELARLKGDRDQVHDKLMAFENDDHYRPRISLPNF